MEQHELRLTRCRLSRFRLFFSAFRVYVLLVKVLNPNGSVSIAASYHFPPAGAQPARRHDLFPTHGNGNLDYSENVCASGNFCASWEWYLKDGSRWNYLVIPSLPRAEYIIRENAYEFFLTPGLVGFWEGEAYNYVLRANTTLKLTDDELNTYINSN